jgi:hypothetical protein
MPYFGLYPEVAGELGDDIELDASTRPPVVHRLHVVFSDWLGDDLLKNYPRFLVTKKLGERLLKEQLTGFELADAKLDCRPRRWHGSGGKSYPSSAAEGLRPCGVRGLWPDSRTYKVGSFRQGSLGPARGSRRRLIAGPYEG